MTPKDQPQSAGTIRAIDTRPAFWLAMFMASAFGANLGDYVADMEARTTSFAVMAMVCLVAVWGDRREGFRTEAWYWVGIIALRAAATNAADFITHDMHISYVLAALVLGAFAIAAGTLTRGPGPSADSPMIDGWYWVAMALAGLFGTVAGDLTSHTTGLFVSSSVLTAVLLLILAVRALLFSGTLLAYWVAVLAERSAATPVADLLDSHRGFALGLPLSMAITLTLFLAALVLRRRLGAGASRVRATA